MRTKIRTSILNYILLLLTFLVSVEAEKEKDGYQLMSTGETPAEYLKRKVESHEVMVFARSYGKQNEQAKSLLKQISKETSTSVEFLDLDLLKGWDGSLLLLELELETGQWALPNIFIGQKHVGGNDEIDQMHAIGELKEMVRQAGQEL
mmetsp:Transcript_84550/g.244410  ORF Transcript_84550/g.244410 Transcript_84550/m.244410 type:complete len:149 (-) Transcript_84550:208-654(-)